MLDLDPASTKKLRSGCGSGSKQELGLMELSSQINRQYNSSSVDSYKNSKAMKMIVHSLTL